MLKVFTTVTLSLLAMQCISQIQPKESETSILRPKRFARMFSDCEVEKTLILIRTLKGETRDHFCSGIFVAPNLFLTAAHCLDKAATLSIPRLLRPALKAQRWETAPGFELEKMVNDVAVVDFSTENKTVYFEDKIARISLTEVSAGAQIAMAGYGPTTLKEIKDQEDYKRRGSNAKLSMGINQISSIGCGEENRYLIIARNDSDEGGSIPYKGDSGGPVFTYNAVGQCGVVGLISRGDFSISYLMNLSEPRVKTWLQHKIDLANQRFGRN